MHSFQARKKTIRQIIFWMVIVGALIALFVPVLTHAQPANVCEVFGNCTAGIDQYSGGGSENISKFFLNIAYAAVFISGALAVLFMVIGGYKMISSNGDAKKYGEGLNTVKNAAIGVALAILSFTIVTVVGNIVSTSDIIK